MSKYQLLITLLLLLSRYVYNLNEDKSKLSHNRNNNNERIPCTIYDNNGNIRPHRVAIFVDTSMIDVFMNWLIFYSSTCRGNLEHLDVICMDKRAKVMVKSIGISCNDDYSFTLNTKLLEKNQMKLKTIWLRRLYILYKYMLSGSDVIFSLEKHFSSIITAAIGGDDDNVVFTLSNDKLVIFSMSLVQEMENFKLDKLKNEPCFLIVYSHKKIDSDIKVMKDMTGGFIIASCDEILSYSFEMNLFYRKCFTNEIISNVFIVSDSEFMVSYKNRKYFDIYDVNEDKLVIRKSFDKIIHFVVANTLQKFITLTRNFKNQRSLHIVKVAVVFESTEIKIFEVRKHEREICFELKSHLPPAGFDSYSVFYGNIEINV
jgi:hypothetical protein